MLVAFDVIIRHLRASGLAVRFVRNVTDIDDKIIRRGHTEGRSAAAVALAMHSARRWKADMRALGIAPADVEPRATEHIAEVLDVVQRLLRSTGASPIRLKATSTTRSEASLVTASSPGRAPMISRRARASRSANTSAAHSTSRCGRARSPVSRSGRARGAPGAPGGTSSVRRWPIAISARRSSCTAGVRI